MDKLMDKLNETVGEIESKIGDFKGEIESVIDEIDSALNNDDAETLLDALEYVKSQLKNIIREF